LIDERKEKIMKLITKEISEKLNKYSYRSQEGTPLMEQKVICKFFNPCGVGTWIILEKVEEQEGDIILWGLCDLGYGYELGMVSLNELESIRLPFGLTIERDLYIPKNCTVKDLIDEKQLMYNI
jgi:hypothetical protein